jgi:cullin 3
MVLHKEGKMLYDGVNKLVAENLDRLAKEKVIPVFPTGGVDDPMHQIQEGELLLKGLKSIWDDHSANMVRLGQILKYMVCSNHCFVCFSLHRGSKDRVYTKTDNVPEIWDAGLQLFLKHIIRPPIQDHLIKAILKQIQFDREGYGTNRSPVKGCVDVFLNLDVDDSGVTVYKRDLEPAVLRESEAFYNAEGERLLVSCDAPEFLRKVGDLLLFLQMSQHPFLPRLKNALKVKIFAHTIICHDVLQSLCDRS